MAGGACRRRGHRPRGMLDQRRPSFEARSRGDRAPQDEEGRGCHLFRRFMAVTPLLILRCERGSASLEGRLALVQGVVPGAEQHVNGARLTRDRPSRERSSPSVILREGGGSGCASHCVWVQFATILRSSRRMTAVYGRPRLDERRWWHSGNTGSVPVEHVGAEGMLDQRRPSFEARSQGDRVPQDEDRRGCHLFRSFMAVTRLLILRCERGARASKDGGPWSNVLPVPAKASVQGTWRCSSARWCALGPR
jgi:hypothetical protein